MTAASSDLHWLSIGELGRRFRARELSPVDVTGAMLDRIARLDGRLHSYLTVTAEAARAAARAAEQELRAGRDRGPLHGVPIALKDLVETKGVATSAGMEILRHHVPEEDACVALRLREAGAVMLGKLAMTEGAYATHHPSIPGPVNPWNGERWTGVSSSGSGVATAAGLCFGSLGSDTGGSIRFPSAANGIVGIKPTWGRVSRHGVFPLAASLDHVGPMCRTVRDAALLLGVIAGHDAGDPTSLRAPVADFTAEIGRGVRGMRIGIDERWIREGMDDEVTGLVLEAARVLESAGAALHAVRVPPTEDLVRVWPVVCAVECAAAHEPYFPARESEYGPDLAALIHAGRSAPATAYAKAHEQRLAFAGRLAGLFEEIDLLLCPSLGISPPPVVPSLPPLSEELTLTLLRFTAPFDFSGSPTLSLPCGFGGDGMPVSLQLVGRHLEEALLCRAGHAYEQATEWHHRHPE
ncbi:MAG: amidase [Candidatus Binatia bacterium]